MKNIIQNIGENIVQGWFYEISIKIFRAQLRNPHPPQPLLLICRQNFDVDFLKTNTVIYYDRNVCSYDEPDKQTGNYTFDAYSHK